MKQKKLTTAEVAKKLGIGPNAVLARAGELRLTMRPMVNKTYTWDPKQIELIRDFKRSKKRRRLNNSIAAYNLTKRPNPLRSVEKFEQVTDRLLKRVKT